MKAFFQSLLDFIFPPLCVSCNVFLNTQENSICNTCKSYLLQQPLPLCKNIVESFALDKIFAAFYFHEKIIRSCLHSGKYNFQESSIATLSEISTQRFIKEKIFPQNTIFVPLPLSRRKKLMRGFNQSEIIAEIFSNAFHFPSISKSLIRKKHTKTQALLNKTERKQNVSEAFDILNPEIFNHACVVLIDDVVTTGATANSAAESIRKKSSPESIWLLCIAHD